MAINSSLNDNVQCPTRAQGLRRERFALPFLPLPVILSCCSSHHTTSGRLVSPEKRAWTPDQKLKSGLPNCSLVDIGARLYVSACSLECSTSALFPPLPAECWAHSLPLSLPPSLLSSPLFAHVRDGENLTWSSSSQLSQRDEATQILERDLLLPHQARESQATQVNIRV